MGTTACSTVEGCAFAYSDHFLRGDNSEEARSLVVSRLIPIDQDGPCPNYDVKTGRGKCQLGYRCPDELAPACELKHKFQRVELELPDQDSNKPQREKQYEREPDPKQEDTGDEEALTNDPSEALPQWLWERLC